ncbi:bone morphogenetic protein 3 isoform X3 [Aptenodytes patagonicus]|uniref:bone morphogenetic protein 3 isoform X3 n=1 Tax=Aptenodytes patagonicus TaxID=9234 RepID=UPI003F9FF5D2
MLAVESMYLGPVFVLCEVHGVCELQKHLKGRRKVWTQLFPLLLRQQGGWDRGAAFFPGVKKRNYCPSNRMFSVLPGRLFFRFERTAGSPGESYVYICRKMEGHVDLSGLYVFLGSPESQEMYVFNLTSLTESENVLSASVYYYIGDLLHVKWNCSQSRGCSRHGHREAEVQIHLSVWTFPFVGNHTRSLGHFLINVSAAYQDVLSWQWKDITHLLHEAKQNNELLISVKMDLTSHHPWKRAPSRYEPYILIYANDSAISEPESVVFSLQGHRHPLARVFSRPENHVRSSLGKQRRKRSTNVLLPLQNNELPGAEYQYNENERWEDRKPYKTFQPRLAERAKSKKKQRKNHHQKSQTLQFDEQTLKKARRKQWNEPRYCARRYLKVDFADIGWSEWIISPKSFDAYYCSGECQFPIPKGGREASGFVANAVGASIMAWINLDVSTGASEVEGA